MSNTSTVKSILTNVESIISALDRVFMLEDLSTTPASDNPYLAVVFYESETFGDVYNEKKGFNTVDFRIELDFNSETSYEGQVLAARYGRNLRRQYTTEDLNVGDLALSKPVCYVEFVTEDVSYKHPVTMATNLLSVRYKEL